MNLPSNVWGKQLGKHLDPRFQKCRFRISDSSVMGLQIPTYFMEHPFSPHRPSSNRGLAPPPIPSGSSSAAVSDLALWIWFWDFSFEPWRASKPKIFMTGSLAYVSSKTWSIVYNGLLYWVGKNNIECNQLASWYEDWLNCFKVNYRYLICKQNIRMIYTICLIWCTMILWFYSIMYYVIR